MLAHMLLCSVQFNCVKEALTAVATLSTENLFLQPHKEEEKQLAALAHKRFSNKDGDLPSLINLYWTWVKANKDRNWARNQFLSQRALLHASEVFKQLAGLLVDLGIDPELSCLPEKEPFLRCVAKGLCLNAAKKVVLSTFIGKTNKVPINSTGSAAAPYKSLVWGQGVHLHPSSVLFSLPGGERKLPEYVVYAEVLVTTKEYMRCVTAIEEKWLTDGAPDLFKIK
jgi:HrpA-like RNA helicase